MTLPETPLEKVQLGMRLRRAGHWRSAAALFGAAWAQNENDAVAATFLSMVHLTQGRFLPGWLGYPARWQNPHWPSRLPDLGLPRWNGVARPALKLMLVAEQGFGDTLQFMRYLPLLEQQQVHLALWLPTPLLRLARLYFPDIVCTDGSTPVECQVWAPLMDVPSLRLENQALGITAPYLAVPPVSRVPYPRPAPAPPAALTPPPHKAAQPKRIGLVWQGRATHPEDADRRMVLADFQALLARFPQCEWLPLQPGTEINLPGRRQIYPDQGQDFLETLERVRSLDLVISVDTAAVHLAAAAGVPTWVLLPATPDWRWMLERDDSPWYPDVQLFRRRHTDTDWQPVIMQVAHALQHWFDTGYHAPLTWQAAPALDASDALPEPDSLAWREAAQQLCNDTAAKALEEGKTALDQQKWKLAFSAASRALRLSPDDLAAQELFNAVRQQMPHADQ